jgi:acyl dehydratase
MRVIETIDALHSLVGQEVGQSDWLLIPQSLIDAFAAVTRDRQWIHVDPGRAGAEAPARTTIAHGFLTLSLLSYLAAQAFQVQGKSMAINYGLNRVRFPAPVPAGSRIRAAFTLQSLSGFTGGVQAVWAARVEVEGASKPALAAEWILRYYR